jgi:hypothetical protein
MNEILSIKNTAFRGKLNYNFFEGGLWKFDFYKNLCYNIYTMGENNNKPNGNTSRKDS